MELKSIRLHFVYGNIFVIIMSRVITNIFLFCIVLHLSRVTIKDAFICENNGTDQLRGFDRCDGVFMLKNIS